MRRRAKGGGGKKGQKQGQKHKGALQTEEPAAPDDDADAGSFWDLLFGRGFFGPFWEWWEIEVPWVRWVAVSVFVGLLLLIFAGFFWALDKILHPHRAPRPPAPGPSPGTLPGSLQEWGRTDDLSLAIPILLHVLGVAWEEVAELSRREARNAIYLRREQWPATLPDGWADDLAKFVVEHRCDLGNQLFFECRNTLSGWGTATESLVLEASKGYTDWSCSTPMRLKGAGFAPMKKRDISREVMRNKIDAAKNTIVSAAQDGRLADLKRLLAEGADPDGKTVPMEVGPNKQRASEPAIKLAAYHGHRDVVEALWRAGANLDATDDILKKTALMSAVQNYKVDCVEALIKFGANLDAVDKRGDTALHRAIDIENAKLLVLAGASRSIRNNAGRTAYEHLALGERPDFNSDPGYLRRQAEVVAWLDEFQAKLERNMYAAVTNGNLEEVERLLEHGLSPDSTLKNGVPALVWAARTGSVEVLEALHRAGAKLDAITLSEQVLPLSDRTALMMTAVKNHSDLLEALLGWGADPNIASTRSGDTALHFAALGGRLECARLLLDAGADHRTKNLQGMTALHYAQNSQAASQLKESPEQLAIRQSGAAEIAALLQAAEAASPDAPDDGSELDSDLDAILSKSSAVEMPELQLDAEDRELQEVLMRERSKGAAEDEQDDNEEERWDGQQGQEQEQEPQEQEQEQDQKEQEEQEQVEEMAEEDSEQQVDEDAEEAAVAAAGEEDRPSDSHAAVEEPKPEPEPELTRWGRVVRDRTRAGQGLLGRGLDLQELCCCGLVLLVLHRLARRLLRPQQPVQPPPDPNPTATLLAELQASRAAADTPMVSLSAAEVAALRAKAQELDSLERNAAAAEERRCCSICLEPYAGEPAAALKLPRVLPCGHSFCEGCITQILRKLPATNEEAHKTITCPKCRDAVAVPRGQARRLPTNYDLID